MEKELEFNEALMKDVPDKLSGLAEIMLFTVDRGINLFSFINESRGRVVITENLHKDVSFLFGIFRKNSIIDYDYSNSNAMSLARPLYVKNYHSFEHDIDEYRQYFFKKYCGVADRLSTKDDCKRLMHDFMSKHEVEWSTVVAATKYMVDTRMKESGKDFVPKASNFIGSDLELWIEQYENREEEKVSKMI